jgi:hypothetical protein
LCDKYHLMVVSELTGQRHYNLAIQNSYTAHSIVIDVKGKDFNSISLLSGRLRDETTISRSY